MRGLFSAQSDKPLAAAMDWLVGLVSGPLAVALATLAVAGIGFLMLRGRVSLRHAGRVLLGCFILFGAASLAQGFLALGSTSPGPVPAAEPSPPALEPEPTQNMVYDPYAGAAVPQPQ